MLADLMPRLAGMDQEDWGYRPRPSLAGPEKCIRQLVYWGLKVPREPLPGRAILIMDDSSWHEELTLNWLRKSAFRVHSEQMEVDLPAPLTKGKIDGLVTSYITNEDFLLEHKAINHFTWTRLQAGHELPLDHFCQVALYLYGLQRVADVTGAILLLKNKNTSAYLEFVLKSNPPSKTGGGGLTLLYRQDSMDNRKVAINEPILIEGLAPATYSVRRFIAIRDLIEKKTLPPRQYEKSSWRCDYCGWGKLCWKDYKEEVKKRSVLVTDDEYLTGLCQRYRQLRDAEDERKELGIKLQREIEQRRVSGIQAGPYRASVVVQNRRHLETNLIPSAVLNNAYVTNTTTFVRVTEKEEEEA